MNEAIMSEPTAEKKDAPAPTAPKLGELFEFALTALINAPGVFAKLEARPAPGPGTSFLVALAWGGAFFALNLLHVTIANPAALQAYAPWQVGVVAFLGLGVWTAMFLLGSSFVYGIGRALGSAGDFDRALLITAVTLAAAPVQALSTWFPMAWVAPALIAAWIFACGLNTLFKTDPWAARGVSAVLAAGVLALQYGAGQVVEKYAATAQLAAVAVQGASTASQLAELQQQVQQIQAAASQLPQGDSGDSPQANRSGLDLLSGPEAASTPSAGPTQREQLSQMSASGDAMNKSVITMLDSMAPLLNNPAITKNMSLQQKADYVELKRMIADMKTGMIENKITSPQEQTAKMMKIQQLVMRMMSAGMTMPSPQAAPAPGAKP
jgi:hypothetical protein